MADQGEGSTTSGSAGLRRSGRTPAKATIKKPAASAPPESSSPAQGKRKARARDAEKSPAEKLEYLLTNSKSKLTKVDVSNVISYNNFLEMSEEAQERLCAALPPTAFHTYVPSVCPSHPDFTSGQQSSDEPMDVDSEYLSRTPATLDPAVFTSPFFLSAAHTFQDHLYSGWLGKKAVEDLDKFTEGAREGTLHAEWKDEVWERNHTEETHVKRKQPAGALDLSTLVKRGLLSEGDVLAYKRTFPALNVTVEKDLLVDSINPNSHTCTFLISPGIQMFLHPSLLVAGPREYEGKVLQIDDIADPIALERGVLDVDGRISYSDKYEQDVAGCLPAQNQLGNAQEQLKNAVAVRAWKAFTVWRRSEETRGEAELQLVQERGGRERVATLFYLRGCCTSSG